MNVTQLVMQKIYSDKNASELLLEMSVRGRETVETYVHALGYTPQEFSHALRLIEECALVAHRMPAIDPSAPEEQRIRVHYIEPTATAKLYADLLREIRSSLAIVSAKHGIPEKMLDADLKE